MMMGVILLISAVVSYVVGGLNGAIMLSGMVYHDDIRNHGSKNPGFTNFKRVYGNNAVTWSVMLIDILKTALPIFATAIVMNMMFGMWQFGAQFSGLFCMIGHCFPVWYGLKGGKAFIAGFTTVWFVDWRMALLAMVVFFGVLAAFKYMSVASCTASAFCPIMLAYLNPASVWVEVLAVVAALLVIVRHYSNFIKLLNGMESKFSLSKK